MKMKTKDMVVNTKVISAFKPCTSRFENWKKQYGSKSFKILEFLSLSKITSKDKIWVCVKILPRSLIEVFAFDCAIKAAAAYAADAAADGAAAYAAYAADAAADGAAAAAAAYAGYAAAAADAAAYAGYAAKTKSLEDSVDALIYLIEGDET
jgi:hypothetical protein